MSQDNRADPVTIAADKRSIGRQYLVDALGAIRTNHSGASAPTVTSPYQFWADTTAGLFKMRNAADDGWVVLAPLGASFSGAITVAKVADFNAAATEATHYTIDCTSGNVTVTLEAASGETGNRYTFKREDASGNTITIDADASETIDGATTVGLASQYDSVTIWCDGTEWWIE